LNILCVIDSLGAGGAQRQLVELATGFKERGHDVSFLVYHNIKFFQSILDKSQIPVYSIIEPRYFLRMIKMRKFIRRGNYDAVLSFLEAANFICEISALPCRKWKLVVGERNANPDISKSIKLSIYRWFHLFSDYVVANSDVNIQQVRTLNPLLSQKKCKVILNLIDFNIWHPLNSYDFRKGSKIKIIVAASHIYRKNLLGLIDALTRLKKEQLDKIDIKWFGDRLEQPHYDGSLAEALEKIKKNDLDKVVSLYPATHDIKSKIQEADVIGLFSFNEGLPNIVCEGMACGKPIICSSVSDVPSILSHQKELLFNPRNSDSICQSLNYLVNLNGQKLSAIGNSNLKLAKEKFNKDFIIENYLQLLNR